MVGFSNLFSCLRYVKSSLCPQKTGKAAIVGLFWMWERLSQMLPLRPILKSENSTRLNARTLPLSQGKELASPLLFNFAFIALLLTAQFQFFQQKPICCCCFLKQTFPVLFTSHAFNGGKCAVPVGVGRSVGPSRIRSGTGAVQLVLQC